MKTTWKEIQPVPTSQEFLDIVLSRTQRRLPTQIRAGFKISRIRCNVALQLQDYQWLISRSFLYPQGQIYARDIYREAIRHP
jgi:GTP1/Obg family GTP-binding protein